MPRKLAASALALLPAGLLLYNTAGRPRARLDELAAPRRLWEDVAIGTTRYLHRNAGEVPTVPINSWPATDMRNRLESYLDRMAEAEGIAPWQFWRTVPLKPFLVVGRERILPREYDDPGRPVLIDLGFRLAGGVAPYLPLWLGALAAAPLLAWASFELSAAGRWASAALFPLLAGASFFVVDALALPYSAVGFYVVAVLLLATVSCYAWLNPAPTPRGLGVRLLAAGCVFAVCALCRSSATLLGGGFLLAILAGVRRAFGPLSPRRFAALGPLALALFLLPYAALWTPRHHAVWGDLWEGLGDFDTTKGHYWSDPLLREFLRREGMKVPPDIGVDFESDESERLARRVVLRHVVEDPAWFAGILARRLAATLTLVKLWAYAPLDGQTFFPSTRPNEGTIDRYYGIATTADVLGVGGWRGEVPMPLVVAPAGVLVGLALAAGLLPRLRSWRAGLFPAVGALGCLAAGALGLPVLITTGALETQAFVLVHFLALGLLLDPLAARLARPRPAPPPATPPSPQ